MPILDKPLPEDRGKKSLLHAVLFPRLKFTFNQAKKWLKDHGYEYIHNRETPNFFRFRIRNEVKGWRFQTIKLNNEIQLVNMVK